MNGQSGEYHDIGNWKVYHFYFTNWPDKSVPKDPGPLLELIQEVGRVGKTYGKPPPVVVHCRYYYY